MTIGENIKKFRKEMGLTQKQLGERCGILEPNIRKYELGKQNPKLETQKKIAKALEIPVSVLNEELSITEDFDTEESSERLAFAIIDGIYELRKKDLIDSFNKLNSSGQNEAIKQVELLTKIPEYKNKPLETSVSINPKFKAGHSIIRASEEDTEN